MRSRLNDANWQRSAYGTGALQAERTARTLRSEADMMKAAGERKAAFQTEGRLLPASGQGYARVQGQAGGPVLGSGTKPKRRLVEQEALNAS